MGLFGGPEAAATAVANTLIAHINEAVALINGLNADIVLPNIAAGNIYALERSLLPEYPAIMVSPTQGKETANAAPNWGEDHHSLDVTIFCQSDDELVLDKQTLRYLWAVWRTLKKYQPLDGSLSGLAGVDTPNYGRTPAYKGDKNQTLMMRAAGLEAVVHIIESVF